MSDSEDPDGGTEGTTAVEAAETVDAVRAHLREVEDGCGCAEVWEHLSERRSDEQ